MVIGRRGAGTPGSVSWVLPKAHLPFLLLEVAPAPDASANPDDDDGNNDDDRHNDPAEMVLEPNQDPRLDKRRTADTNKQRLESIIGRNFLAYHVPPVPCWTRVPPELEPVPASVPDVLDVDEAPWFDALNFSVPQRSANQFCIVTRVAVWSSPDALQILSQTLWMPVLKFVTAALLQKQAFAVVSSAAGRIGWTQPP